MAPSKTIEVAFPDRDPGYYVVEVDWIVADTPSKFVSSFIVEYKDEVSLIGLNTSDGECLEHYFNVDKGLLHGYSSRHCEEITK